MTAAISLDNARPSAAAGTSRVGVLLVNLGTPDTADAAGVRVYLKEFLSDPRVIEDQGLLWKIILNGIILRIRPARKARDYLTIWNTEKNESPLKTITRVAELKSLQRQLPIAATSRSTGRCATAIPRSQSRIEALMAQGCDRILVVPLYPQYSAATSATVCDEAFRVLRKPARPADPAGDAALL